MYHLHLENFEGPFDLLYQLLEKNKLDINEVSLAEIAGQYLEYVRQMQEMDLEMAGEFLLMAVKLVELKTRRILPGQNDTEENEEAKENAGGLIQKVLEYRRFKELAGLLRQKEEERDGIFTRDNEQMMKIIPVDDSEDDPLEGVGLEELVGAFESALKKMREIEKKRRKEELRLYQWEMYTVRDRIREIKKYIQSSPRGFNFDHLFPRHPSRVELVVTFLALLELIKQKEIRVVQVEPFQTIRLKPY